MDLGSNSIKDIGVLSELTNLITLDIGEQSYAQEQDEAYEEIANDSGIVGTGSGIEGWNRVRCISDISVLGNLTKLQTLDLGYNNISDINILGGLTKLSTLDLGQNNIDDISILSSLPNLLSLNLGSNESVSGDYLYSGNLDSKVIDFLKGLPNLKEIWIYDGYWDYGESWHSIDLENF